MHNKILIIEDDVSVSEMIKNYLEKDGYIVVTADDGDVGIVKFNNDTYELIILDIMMPKLNGIEVLKYIRGNSLIPVLIISAKDTEVEKALGLELGADDYIAKPFSLLELSARVKAAIRRATSYSKNENNEINKTEPIKYHDLIVDINNYSVFKNGCNLKLTSKEFDIFKLLIKNPSRVFTKEQIYNTIWDNDYFGDENVINVHMRRLREKIEDNPSDPQYIKTIWGIGYKLGN